MAKPCYIALAASVAAMVAASVIKIKDGLKIENQHCFI
jgi:hypothetical protein